MKKAKFYYKNSNAPKPNKPNHIGTSILIEYGDRVLLERRQDSDTWAFIGGGLKTDESLMDCVVRETLEETGIALTEDAIDFNMIYDDPSRIAHYPDGNVLRVITVVYHTVLSEQPNLICSSESKELRFFSREELKNIPIAATHIPIAEDYLRG